jgi:hypothetical protein
VSILKRHCSSGPATAEFVYDPRAEWKIKDTPAEDGGAASVVVRFRLRANPKSWHQIGVDYNSKRPRERAVLVLLRQVRHDLEERRLRRSNIEWVDVP